MGSNIIPLSTMEDLLVDNTITISSSLRLAVGLVLLSSASLPFHCVCVCAGYGQQYTSTPNYSYDPSAAYPPTQPSTGERPDTQSFYQQPSNHYGMWETPV